MLLMNKKIMFAVSRLTSGGAERVVSLWTNMLSERNYDVVLLLAYRCNNEYPISNKVRVLTISESKEEYLTLNLIDKVSIIRKNIKNEKVDCVISFLLQMQILVMFASFGLRCKRVETVRVNPWKQVEGNKIYKILWKMCFITCDKAIIQTEEQSLFFNKKIKEKMVVIPNPLSKCYINKYKKNSDFRICNFIAVGRISQQKNYEMMISVFSIVKEKYNDVHLDIYGDGDPVYINKISNQIKKMKMESYITLKGRNSNMENVYPLYDVFLMTSDFEGLPNALIEAMACRLICVSTNCRTGPKDLIENGVNGFLTQVGKIDDMVNTIFKVMGLNKDEKIIIMDNARNTIMNHCSEKKSIERLCSLIDSFE